MEREKKKKKRLRIEGDEPLSNELFISYAQKRSKTSSETFWADYGYIAGRLNNKEDFAKLQGLINTHGWCTLLYAKENHTKIRIIEEDDPEEEDTTIKKDTYFG